MTLLDCSLEQADLDTEAEHRARRLRRLNLAVAQRAGVYGTRTLSASLVSRALDLPQTEEPVP